MIIDINSAYGPWPFWRHGMETIGALAEHLHQHEIKTALVSPLEAPFSSDLDVLNEQLFSDCQCHDALLPLPVLSPAQAGWERRLHGLVASGAVGIKLHPTHHLYSLSDPATHALADQMESLGLPVVLTVRLEDVRGQYRGLTIGDLSAAEVAAFSQAHPSLNVVCLNATQPEILQMSRGTGPGLHFDIAFAETGTTLDSLLERVESSRLLFGSQTPLLYTKAALLKLRACTAPMEERLAVCSGNARRLFGHSGRL